MYLVQNFSLVLALYTQEREGNIILLSQAIQVIYSQDLKHEQYHTTNKLWVQCCGLTYLKNTQVSALRMCIPNTFVIQGLHVLTCINKTQDLMW